MYRRTCKWLLLLLLVFCFSTAAAEGLRGYNKEMGGYQYLQLGTYPYEQDGQVAPVLWRVLEVKDQEALLMTEYVIECKQVTFIDNEKDREKHNYPDLTDFQDSDLAKWLNSDMIFSMFAEDPMINAVKETERGKLWLLDYDELTRIDWGFEKGVWGKKLKTRRAYTTPYAQKSGVYVDRSTGTCSWWVGTLRYKSGKKRWLASVDGHISVGFFGRVNVGIRPAMRVDLDRIGIVSGAGTKDDPFIAEYQDVSVSSRPFRAVAEASASDVQFVSEKTADDESGEIVLSFIGDCSIGDATQSRASEASLTNVIKSKGYDWPFSLLSDHLQNDDYTFANLEVVFTERAGLKSSKKYNMIGQPDFVNVLLNSGIDVLNTVNNHCFDFTEKGYQDTLDALDQAGLNHFGTIYPGMAQESDILGVVDIKGIRIGMLGLSYPHDTQATVKVITSRIRKLREEYGCNLVVCSFHWGHEEHMTKFDREQFSLAQKTIDAGADLIWGHHPHVLQPVFFYKGKPVMMSTGNFIFGTMSQVNPATGIFQLHYQVSEQGPVLTELSVIPCETGKRGDYRPFELTEEKDRLTCWGYLVYKKKVSKMENLPASFANTGRVLISPEGELLDAE